MEVLTFVRSALMDYYNTKDTGEIIAATTVSNLLYKTKIQSARS
jgi:hypothetical protein